MHGQIGFESAPDRGSTFWFTLRFACQADQKQTPQMASTLEGFRILVVDDNETNRDIVHRQAISWKMRNGSAQGGKAALETLRAAARAGDPFHIAIIDMQMPEMDGLSLARAIKADPEIAATHLVMLTSLGHLPEERRWRESGIASYLVKPVKETRLYDTLVSILRGAASLAKRGTGANAGKPAASRSTRVLVAEDNIVNQKVTLRQLQKLGYSADAVANGLEVIEAIKHIPYDVILMDCQMPELDGYEATRLIRAEEHKRDKASAIYIIAMTANALAGDREECLTSGMNDYISKPVRMEELDAAISRGLRALNEASEREHGVLDDAILRSVRELRVPGEPDPLTELIDLFLSDTPPRLGKVLDAFKAGDVDAVERATHGIKGSASNLGAKGLAAACAEVIAIARSGKLPEAAQVARILSEFERLKPVLEKEKQL
jgi:two-component system sensor histidine kinase/response regulator